MTERKVAPLYRRVTERRDLASRRLDSGPHPAIHVFEQEGSGDPVVLLHGGGGAAYVWLPLSEHLEGRHLLVPDRPGFGLSDPVGYDTDSFRAVATRFVEATLDALEIQRVDLVGNSIGGTWSLWYAMARPERVRRLVLVGAPPLLPGTRIPAPLRVMATPGVGGLLNRLMTPSAGTVRRIMSSFGEGDTIVDHPEVVEAMVADNSDPITSAVGVEETRAIIGPIRGFRTALRVTEADLSDVVAPTLLVWGSDDPVGGSEVARRTADALPNARLEMVDAGHLPWLGHPRQVAELIGDHL